MISSNFNWRSHGILIIQAIISKAGGCQNVEEKYEDYVRSLSSKRIKGAGNEFCIKGAS